MVTSECVYVMCLLRRSSFAVRDLKTHTHMHLRTHVLCVLDMNQFSRAVAKTTLLMRELKGGVLGEARVAHDHNVDYVLAHSGPYLCGIFAGIMPHQICVKLNSHSTNDVVCSGPLLAAGCWWLEGQARVGWCDILNYY